MIRRLFIIVIFAVNTVASLSQVRTLDYFIQQGLANSPLMKDLSNQLHSNTLDSLIVGATRLPQVNYNGVLSYAPVVNGYGYSEAITNGGNFVSVVNVSQPLFNKKTVAAQYSKIGLQGTSLLNTSAITGRDLKKAITAQYLAACSVSGDITFNKVLIRQAKDEEQMLVRLVQSGLYKQTDYLSFLLEMESLEFQQNDLQTQYQRAVSDLELMCGIGDTSLVELEMPDLVIKASGNKGGSPFFQRFAIDSLRIQNDRLMTDRGYKPRISWYTDAGLVNNDPALIYKNLGLSLGLSFSVPVFDGNQRKLNIEKLKTSEVTRQNYRDFFGLQYLQQLRQLNQSLKQTGDLVPRLQKQLDLAESIIRQDKLLLNNGGISVTDYVIALKNYVAIQANLNQYRIRVLQIINEINYWKE
ncbi:MAG: TolC family protein [Bacteroidota bacterium]